MLSKAGFNITRRACEIRVAAGEDINVVVEDYAKLSDEQKQELIEFFTNREVEGDE